MYYCARSLGVLAPYCSIYSPDFLSLVRFGVFWSTVSVNFLLRKYYNYLNNIDIRGAKVGGVGGVATPPEFWKGGLTPLIFKKICVEIIKIRLFCVKFLKVGLF